MPHVAGTLPLSRVQHELWFLQVHGDECDDKGCLGVECWLDVSASRILIMGMCPEMWEETSISTAFSL